MDKMPRWADIVLIPFISLLLAAFFSALVILAIGENPIEALKLMIDGALMRSSGWGYTLYYATNFIFTGLAVSVAFHARLFNIGGEGQAMIGGLGVALVCRTGRSPSLAQPLVRRCLAPPGLIFRRCCKPNAAATS